MAIDGQFNLDILISEHNISTGGAKLLDVLITPEARTMSVTKICEIAGINRGTYYNCFKSQAFVEAYYKACKLLCITAAMPTVQSVAGQAIAGDMQAAKLVLEMTGLHQPTSRVEHIHTHEAGPTLKEMLQQRKPIR